jgi:hypothetical protein
MVVHIRKDNGIDETNDKRRMLCGIGPELPPGDKCIFEGDNLYHLVDCPGCNGGKQVKLGTPISELSGRPGHPGYEKFVNIAKSWGYE